MKFPPEGRCCTERWSGRWPSAPARSRRTCPHGRGNRRASGSRCPRRSPGSPVAVRTCRTGPETAAQSAASGRRRPCHTLRPLKVVVAQRLTVQIAEQQDAEVGAVVDHRRADAACSAALVLWHSRSRSMPSMFDGCRAACDVNPVRGGDLDVAVRQPARQFLSCRGRPARAGSGRTAGRAVRRSAAAHADPSSAVPGADPVQQIVKSRPRGGSTARPTRVELTQPCWRSTRSACDTAFSTGPTPRPDRRHRCPARGAGQQDLKAVRVRQQVEALRPAGGVDVGERRRRARPPPSRRRVTSPTRRI